MTEEEILSEAKKITERRKREDRGREIFNADRVEIVAWDDGRNNPVDRVDLIPSAELAQLLCKAFDVEQLGASPKEAKGGAQ